MITETLALAIAEIQQPRSRYQLEAFVVGQHDTPEMRYYQCLLEINDLVYKYRLAQIAVRKAEIEVARLRATGDEIDELDAQEKEIGLEQTRLAMIGCERELGHLIELWQSFPIKYSREQIEQAQPDYWRARLTRQAEMQAIGQGTVDWAQIDALRQAGLLEEFVGKYAALRASSPAGELEDGAA